MRKNAMLKLLLRYKWHIGIILALMIVEPTINATLNFWLQSLFNSASAGADRMYVLRLLTGGFLLWMLKRVVTYVMLIFRDHYICNMKRDMRDGMFKKLLRANVANISDSASSGEYISMFTNDVLLLEQRYFNQIMGLVSGIFSIAILGYSFVALNSTLAFAIIGFGFVTMFVPAAFARRLNTKNTVYTKKIAAMTQRLKEFIIAFPTIKNYSVEPAVEQRFSETNNATEKAKYDADCALSLANSVGQLLAWFMQFIGVGLGIMMVVKGEIMIGTVIAAQSFASDLALPIQNIVININSIRSVTNIVNKLDSLADEYPTEGTAAQDSDTAPMEACDIAFQGVTLERGGKTIVDDFSFCFESGKKYLVVGVNGAGKSSVFKVLKKWYKHTSGTITINGADIDSYTNKLLSRVVSYINENVSLISGTVQENISLFRSHTEEELQQAVAESHMELSMSKVIADEGRNISSGEQRRIELARSLLKSASVLIFDEVVSTLDIETAYEIEKAVFDLQDKTVIFISHNFSGKLIGRYDCILVMNDGKLVASGTYEELCRESAYFRNICDIKFGRL